MEAFVSEKKGVNSETVASKDWDPAVSFCSNRSTLAADLRNMNRLMLKTK